MALPDYIDATPGTPVIWGESGASGVTKTLSFDALAAGSARMGAYADLGSPFAMAYSVMLVIESGTAPTAGGTVELYLVCSHASSGFWAGGVSGSVAAWPADGNEDEWRKRFDAPATILKATNDADTVQVQDGWIWRPSGRYVVPVVDNNMDQAVRDEGTATNNDSRVILVPLRTIVSDS